MGLKRKKVLVIDDDQDFREIIKLICESQGMTVYEASTIPSAFESVKMNYPHIIVLDLNFEKAHGNEFLESRQSNPMLKRIPVVVCSQTNLAEVIKQAIKYGADDYIIKPIKQTWLIQRMRKHLMNDEMQTLTFHKGEMAQVKLNVTPVALSETSCMIKSSFGMNPNEKTGGELGFLKDNGIRIDNFRSEEKSRYDATGPFLTVLTLLGMTENEILRIKQLKLKK